MEKEKNENNKETEPYFRKGKKGELICLINFWGQKNKKRDTMR